MEVIEQLKESGKVSRGYLGVQGGEVSSDLAIALGMDKPYGALVRSVVEGEAAESSGILPGDVIVEIDGKEIIYFKDLQHNIGRTRPETEVVAKIFRQGKYISLDILVGELPMVQEVNETKEEPKDPDYPLGMNLREVDPNNRAPNDPEYGLRVLRVFSNSPALAKFLKVT